MRFTSIILVFIIFACNSNSNQSTAVKDAPKLERKPLTIPQFITDSAYQYIADQVEFGKRIPNTEAHVQTKDYLVDKLEKYCDEVVEQSFTATRYDGVSLQGFNIIGSINPDADRRMLLLAHWDSRFIADHANDKSKVEDGVMGADDGASGVGVLIEMARMIKNAGIDVGVDILFTDLEDQGKSNDADGKSWCLGAQYWARNPHIKGYRADYGILLDMVGAKGAKFLKEGVSLTYAPELVHTVWQLANSMGYGQYFINKTLSNGVVDDHLFINQIIGIPTIDIINKPSNSSFGPHWHTENDNMDVIDKDVLKAVGRVVTATLYRFDANYF